MTREEANTQGMKRQAQELIEQAYYRGFKAGRDDRQDWEKDQADRLFEKGRDETWEAVRKLYWLPDNAIREIFGVHNWIGIVQKFSASEVVEKLRAYEGEQKENSEFHIGDEVTDGNGIKGVVVGAFRNSFGVEYISVLGTGEDFEVPQVMPREDYKKTGRHFPEIAEVLKKLKEDE